MKIAVIHGPNINMLGSREPDKYGNSTIAGLNQAINERALKLNIDVLIYQSNIEGEIVSNIQSLTNSNVDGIIINAAAYTHTSIAIRDALLAVNIPFVEVHLSNIFNREPFRHISYLSDIALGVISGFKADSYLLALEGITSYLRAQE